MPGGRLGEAGAIGVAEVVKNYAKAKLDGTEYTSQMAMQDFIVATLGDLAGDGLEAAYKRFGKKRVDKLLSNLGLPGTGKSQKNKLVEKCACFTKGTKVLTSEGYKEIQEIEVGDIVWAYDEATGKLVEKEVTDTFIIQEDDKLYHLFIGDEEIEATGSHPFFIGGRWIEVKDLAVGDSVQLYSGEKLPITKIEIEEGEFTVYNFSVKDVSNYYVSELSILVHNCSGVKLDNSETSKLSPINAKKFDEQPSGKGPRERFGKFDIAISDGKIWQKSEGSGKPKWSPLSSGDDLLSFVVTSDGQLQIGYGHYNLSNSAASVLAAGSIQVSGGKVSFISNGSGHYQPTMEDLDKIVSVLEKLGVTSPDMEKKSFKFKQK